MNYVSVVSVGLVGAVIGLYVVAKRGKYRGPRVPDEDLSLMTVGVSEGLKVGTVHYD